MEEQYASFVENKNNLEQGNMKNKKIRQIWEDFLEVESVERHRKLGPPS